MKQPGPRNQLRFQENNYRNQQHRTGNYKTPPDRSSSQPSDVASNDDPITDEMSADDCQKLESEIDGLIQTKKLENLYAEEAIKQLARCKLSHPNVFAAIKMKLKEVKQFIISDFNRLIKTQVAIVRKTAASSTNKRYDRYFKEAKVLCKTQQTESGDVTIQRSNFVAQIVEEIIIDDGVEQIRAFVIVGIMQDGRKLPKITVLADEFQSLNWIVREWGHAPIVWPRYRLDFAAGVQCISRDAGISRTYRHTGWFRNKLGENQFLTKSGALGQNGLDKTAQVELNSPLDKYDLPKPPGG